MSAVYPAYPSYSIGPMIAKALTLPANHRSGLNYDQSIPPSRPPEREPRPENTIFWINPWTLGCSLIDRELMSQCDVLKLQ
jgi:hypothetical protein